MKIKLKRYYSQDSILNFGKYKRLRISYVKLTDKKYYNWLKKIITIN